MYTIILIVLLLISFAGIKILRRKWKDTIWLDVGYCVFWLIYSVIAGVTAVRLPSLWYSSYVVFAIAAILIMLLHASYDRVFEGKKFEAKIAFSMVRLGLYECVACGVLLPQLIKWYVPWMSEFLTISIFHINGNIGLIVIFELVVCFLETKAEYRSFFGIAAQFFVGVFHAMIVYVTGSIVLLVLLRAGYILLYKTVINKRLKNG